MLIFIAEPSTNYQQFHVCEILSTRSAAKRDIGIVLFMRMDNLFSYKIIFIVIIYCLFLAWQVKLSIGQLQLINRDTE